MPGEHPPVDLAVWRHPRPDGAAGRCVGRIDLPIDPRRVRRLAGRIRRAARREARPLLVFTSPLRRCREVGRCLRRWGWTHHVDARLLEADFGNWEGRLWSAIGVDEVDAWVRDFADHRPGGGESVREVLQRCRAFLAAHGRSRASVVTHGGWISSLDWRARYDGVAEPDPVAAQWPQAIGYACRRLRFKGRQRPGSG